MHLVLSCSVFHLKIVKYVYNFIHHYHSCGEILFIKIFTKFLLLYLNKIINPCVAVTGLTGECSTFLLHSGIYVYTAPNTEENQ